MTYFLALKLYNLAETVVNYRQIEAFEAVMKTGSMTLAGKLLFITQPAVSRLIIELEQELGFKLFERKKTDFSVPMKVNFSLRKSKNRLSDFLS